MIVRDCVDTLEVALKSIRPWVDEICVCDTGSTDGTMDLARRYADKVELFLGCNDPQTGLIADFSSARNRSFDMATGDFALWIDSDDEFIGGENLRGMLEQATTDNVVFMAAYEYAFDASGRCTCVHWRERIVRPAHRFSWQSPIHEVLLPVEPIQGSIQTIRTDLVRVKHRRKPRASPGPGDENRNLRILKAHVAKARENDVRALYYLGLEYSYVGDVGRAIRYLRRYIALSQWNDEKCLAVLELARLYGHIGDFDSAVEWSLLATTIRGWPDGYWRLGRCFYALGMDGIDREYNFKRAAHFIQLGFTIGDTETVLFVDPTERFRIHEFLNVVLSTVGDLDGAIASCEAGLVGLPENPHLRTNLQIYSEKRAMNRAKTALSELSLTDAQRVIIDRTLSGDFQVELLDRPVPMPSAAAPSLRVGHAAPAAGKLDLVFCLGHQLEPWNPDTVAKNGIGGSETMALEVAKRLAKMGHAVRMFGHCTPTMEGVFDGVLYLDASKYPNTECDVLISSRKPQTVDDQWRLKAKARVLWVHDIHCGDELNFVRDLRFDRILCLTDWHKRFFLSCYPRINPAKVEIMRNAIDLSRFAGTENRDPHRAIYSSSPDRGLEALLECWPEIRRRVPDATLHVFYGFFNWETSARMCNDEPALRFIAHLKHLAQNTEGVVFRDRVNQRELAREFMRSGVFTYPQWFDETSCITAMEAMEAGCEIVASNKAGLGETVRIAGRAARLIDWGRDDHDQATALTPEYREEFVEQVVDAMLNGNHTRISDKRAEGLEKWLTNDLNKRAEEWDEFLLRLVAEMTERVVPPFHDAEVAA